MVCFPSIIYFKWLMEFRIDYFHYVSVVKSTLQAPVPGIFHSCGWKLEKLLKIEDSVYICTVFNLFVFIYINCLNYIREIFFYDEENVFLYSFPSPSLFLRFGSSTVCFIYFIYRIHKVLDHVFYCIHWEWILEFFFTNFL